MAATILANGTCLLDSSSEQLCEELWKKGCYGRYSSKVTGLRPTKGVRCTDASSDSDQEIEQESAAPMFPFLLAPEEALYLLAYKEGFAESLQIGADAYFHRFIKADCRLLQLCQLYRHYRMHTNWIVRKGLKFGGDFGKWRQAYLVVLYEESPVLAHSKFVVYLNADSWRFTEIQAAIRSARQVKKKCLFIFMPPLEGQPPEPCFLRYKDETIAFREVCLARWHAKLSQKAQ